jgi:hypothetical protein
VANILFAQIYQKYKNVEKYFLAEIPLKRKKIAYCGRLVVLVWRFGGLGV